MRWRLYILFFLLLFLFKGNAQDQHFSQFYANPLYLSPSLAGSTDGSRLVLNYRNQWPAISEAFSTYAVSFDHFLSRFNSGLGAYLIQDRAGSAGLTSTNAAFQYSYNLMLNSDWQIVPAVQVGYGNRYIDFTKAVFPDQGPSNISGASGAYGRLLNDQVHYFDMAASVFLYSAKYWGGFTLDHIGQPNYSFLGEDAKVSRKFVLFGGMNLWSEKRRFKGMTRSFSTSFRFQNQATQNQLDAGAYWYNDPIEVGIWYRGIPIFKGAESSSVNHDAIIVLLAYKISGIRVAYSYDITISGLGWSTAGAHEVSLIYEFNQRGALRLGGKRPAVPCSDAANPLVKRKYKRQRQRAF